MKPLLCLLWGHTIGTERLGGVVCVRCRRCTAHLMDWPINERIPAHIHWRNQEHVTLGPLRRLVETYRCLLFGHDDALEWMEARFDEYEQRCRTCGHVARTGIWLQGEKAR